MGLDLPFCQLASDIMEALIKQFISIAGDGGVLRGEDLKFQFNHIWKMDSGLNALCLLYPASASQLSEIMKICYELEQPVVVFGGRSNLVGSTETSRGEVVIAMDKMNGIEEVDSGSRTMTVQAGVILENIQIEAQKNNLFFPLNFGAKGSAQIGGILSTNAGGMRVLRYGMTRNLVLGVEAVLADGRVVSSMKKIIKDNSAYDIKHLFIGSEGTLGVVTRAVLKLEERPLSRNCAFVSLNGYDNVIALLKSSDQQLAGTLSAFELMWRNTFEIMTNGLSDVKAPLGLGNEYYVLIESLGSNQEDDRVKLERVLEEALNHQIITDAALANSSDDVNMFFKIREEVHVLKSQCTFDQHFDISIPIPKIGKTIDRISEELREIEEVEQIFTFGHVADGNIHYVIGKSNDSPELKKRIDDVVYRPIKSLGGSVSAEHGIGLHKKDYLKLCRSEEEIALMHSLKKMMDPKNIMNRNKVL